jgi:tRNA threonylcarbamoyl adenosine modification protein (Sua5/YciO/YrdC/YwlC family)
MAEHVYTYENPCSEKDLARICAMLDRGGVMAYPSDVSWGFACNAGQVRAIERIRKIRFDHPKDQPFSILCASLSMASNYVNIDNSTFRIVQRALPGPYTFLLERNRSVARQLKDKRRVIGLRIPARPLLTELITRYGSALVTSSVPAKSDGSPYKFGYEIMEVYGHALDMVIDLGEELSGLETTIVDLTEHPPTIVREGAGDTTLFL